MWSIFDDPVGGSTGPLTHVYSHFTSIMVSPVPMVYWLDTSTSALPSSLLRSAGFPPCTQGEASVLCSTSSSYRHTARLLLSPLVGPLFHSTAVLLLGLEWGSSSFLCPSTEQRTGCSCKQGTMKVQGYVEEKTAQSV